MDHGPPATRTSSPPWYLQAGIAGVGVAVGVVAYRMQIDNLGPGTSPVRAGTVVAAGWTFLLAGLIGWSRRPANRLGPLMLLTGFALMARQIRYSHDPLAFTTFFALGELGYALFAHTALAYPSGRVTDRLERTFLKVMYATAVVFPLAILLFYDGSDRLRYFDPVPRESLLLVHGDADVVDALTKTYAVLGYGVLAAAFIGLIARRLVRATPRSRRILAPLLLAAAVAAMRAVFDSVITFASRPPDVVYWNLFWWQMGALIAVPLLFLAGMLRSRLAYASAGELVVQLQRTPPHGIRDALARALGDPTLEVVFWLPDRHEFADVDGRPMRLPDESATRAVTMLDGEDGQPLAALIHDPALRDEPGLVDVAAAAARLALENARLHAEVQAQLAKVKESRARIVAAGDEQRRRIERDLHDGAQQRLVALALELRRAQRELGADLDPALDELLTATADELQVAVQELRDLAAGIHPPVLTQGGLAVALDALAQRAPLPVTVAADIERLSAEVEGTGYFVAAEALANVAKHANASRASISASLVNGSLVVEVSDDGVGGAGVNGGTGLRGLVDRVEARGGRLSIESPPGGGTRVIGEIPCVL
jgi:signal transduction histidine kinase